MRSYFISFLLLFICSFTYANSVVIQSTTSTRDSGLYKYLLPMYPKFDTTKIKVIAVGTGQAIINAKNCDGNILIVHDRKQEDDFIDGGYGNLRHDLMYNDFVLVGPAEDKSNVSRASTVLDAFALIYNSSHPFISRSDSSGTHSAEMNIWKQLNLNPKKHSGRWYLESGQGMGPSLNIAISLNAYILTDRSTWLRFKNKRNHSILYENRYELKNNYSMILVNHERCKNLSKNSAMDLFNWLASDDAAKLIKRYQINKENVFYID
mgnify:CR=1 FL=1